MDNGIHILNLEAYSTPSVYEMPYEDFVAYGDDNNFYSELIDTYLNSPTSQSIITGVVNQIFGKGFSALDSSRKPNEYAQFKSIFSNQDLRRVCLDLKLLGEGAFQVTYKGKKVQKVTHFNRETLRAEKCDAKGKINAYYYYPKWVDYKKGDKLTRIPIFGSGAKNEIFIVRSFLPSMHYYTPPDWVSSLNYGKLECNISEYLVNEVNNSFSGTKLVSFTNGTPTVEKQIQIKNEVLNKLTGANGEKVIVSFSDSPENKTTIEDISVSDAADVYSYISEECTKKLLLAHRITSPLLVGIRDGQNGLGSNAEEIKNAANLFDNIVIKPYQNMMCEAIQDILSVNKISLKLYVQTLMPIEFTDTENVRTEEDREEETGQKLSSEKPVFDIDMQTQYSNYLINLGEDESEDYVLIEAEDATGEDINTNYEEILNKSVKLAAVPSSLPLAPSEQDSKIFKVRYAYVQGATEKDFDRVHDAKNHVKGVSRPFCEALFNSNKIFRKEDILQMETDGINKEFGHKKQPYSIWLYAGGINCYHRWERRIYKKMLKKDGERAGGDGLSNTNKINVNEAVRQGFKLPKNPKDVAEAEILKPNRGAYKA